MSKYTMRKSINRAFSQQLVSNYIIRIQAEQLERYTVAQSIALEEGDLEEVEILEKKISELITEKI